MNKKFMEEIYDYMEEAHKSCDSVRKYLDFTELNIGEFEDGEFKHIEDKVYLAGDMLDLVIKVVYSIKYFAERELKVMEGKE